jgi:hypothetical protein
LAPVGPQSLAAAAASGAATAANATVPIRAASFAL